MRLRNKKTGEIVELFGISRKGDRTFIQFEDERGVFKGEYSSLAELNAEWDDYEEPKEYWYIDYEGGILIGETDNSLAEKMMISIGNHFKTLSEAEKAVEKLKAWKRLKDGGCKIVGWEYSDNVDLNGCNFNDDDVMRIFAQMEYSLKNI